MENNNVNPFSTPRMGTLLSVYDQVRDVINISLSQVLRITNSSYTTAMRDANMITQQDGKYRGMYENRSHTLMQYDQTEELDPEMENLTIELIVTAVNDFLSSFKEMPDQSKEKGRSALKEIKVLFMQLICHNAFNITDQFFVPDYMKDYVEKALDLLNRGAEDTFQALLQDFIETGNENLVDYVQMIGPEIFGWETNNEASKNWTKYMDPYIVSLKNPKELRKRYLARRGEFSRYTRNIDYKLLYDTFEITKGEFHNRQDALFSKFTTCYSENVDIAAIKKLIYGI